MEALLTRLHAAGIMLSILPGRLRVRPSDRVTPELLTEIKVHKRAIAECLTKHESRSTKPYINQYGDLVIPFGSDTKHHYWKGGQSIADTLKLLGVTMENMRHRN
jgi:hypothetical protein